MPTKKLTHIPRENLPLHGDLPSVPAAFRQSDYDGWLVERVKRFQLKQYQKTQGERLAVLKQINEIQTQCLAIARNENTWRHFGQEDRLHQKRLDIEELELDMKMEELQERRQRARTPVVHKPAEPRDPIREALNRLRNKLRTGVEARSEVKRLKEEFPDYAAEIEQEFRKMIADLREGV